MAPRVAVLSLASDFGCQLQMTNIEDDLLAVLGRIELSYWQLASSGHLPEEYDVAIIEGAVTTTDHLEVLRKARATAAVVIAVGACAHTGGIPALAAGDAYLPELWDTYGDTRPDGASLAIEPRAVTSVIDVDYVVPGCPIDQTEYLSVVSRALAGLSDRTPIEPMCASCKVNENVCFFEKDEICLGVITRTGCGARCVSLGRPCTGCRGLAPDANLGSARQVFASHGHDLEQVLAANRIYNSIEKATI